MQGLMLRVSGPGTFPISDNPDNGFVSNFGFPLYPDPDGNISATFYVRLAGGLNIGDYTANILVNVRRTPMSHMPEHIIITVEAALLHLNTLYILKMGQRIPMIPETYF